MMEKTTTFFNGDPAEVKFFGPSTRTGIKAIKEETKKNFIKGRDEARKNPPPFALVQNPEVYDK